jgi:signal transduction histidine kinase
MRWLRLFLLVCALVMAQQGAALAFERSLNQANISVTLAGGLQATMLGQQTLPWKWDSNFPRQHGVARFEFSFDLSDDEFVSLRRDNDGLGLMSIQMGNRYRYQVNGSGWRYVGWNEGTTQYRSKPRWHALAAEDLRRGNNTLIFELRMAPANDAGLAPLLLNDLKVSTEIYQKALNIRNNSSMLVSFSASLMGLLALAMWLITKERLFALTSFAEFAFSIRQLAIFVDYPPLPTWLWNAIFACLFALYVGAVGLISSDLITKKSRWIERMMQTYLGLSVPFLLTGYALDDYRFYRFWLAVMIAITMVLVARVTWYAIKTSSLNVRLYAFAAWFAMLFGLYDFLMIQTNAAGLGKVRLGTYTTFLFNASLAVVVIRKFMASKQELFEAQVRIKVEREHAAMTERQRIMSDIHDTVGSQLVGVLGMIRSGANHAQLESETSLALEDLRSAIDAIQPVNGNLAAVLATLRHRLEPRLHAHGLKLVWQLDDLPRMANMTPQVIQHIQRIVLEVLTNVIKHAGATTVTFSARTTGSLAGVVIDISDDGAGFDTHALAHQGQGLNNIKLRAEAIGATVSFKNASSKGARVVLEF